MKLRTSVGLIASIVLSTACTSDTVPSRSFSLSPSLQHQCEGDGLHPDYCEPLNAAVIELKAETRDDAWADRMEALLAGMMTVEGKVWGEARSIECRRTLCAIEFAMPVSPPPQMDKEPMSRLKGQLEPTIGGFAPEFGVDSSKFRSVYVMICRRIRPGPG
jgi:hypothetical protein